MTVRWTLITLGGVGRVPARLHARKNKAISIWGSEDRVSLSRKRKGLRSSAGKRDNRHPWVMSRVQAKSRWLVTERNPHQRSKANSALTSIAPFDCTHGVAAPRAGIKQQCEVSLCIEWILRGAMRGAVQPGAATSAAPLSCAARLELSSVERLPRLINLGE